jgi:hypothetical protein
MKFGKSEDSERSLIAAVQQSHFHLWRELHPWQKASVPLQLKNRRNTFAVGFPDARSLEHIKENSGVE